MQNYFKSTDKMVMANLYAEAIEKDPAAQIMGFDPTLVETWEKVGVDGKRCKIIAFSGNGNYGVKYAIPI